jgi:hypothetical protein
MSKESLTSLLKKFMNNLYAGEHNSETIPPQQVFKEFFIGFLVKFSAFSTFNG